MDILTQIGITKEELIDRIVDTALGITAGYEQTGHESWEELPLSEVVDKKIETAIGKLVDRLKDQIEKQIDKIMAQKIEEVFNAPFQRTNQWGDKIGEPTTIRDMVANEAINYWNQKVDDDGKTSKYNSKQTMAEYHAKQVVKKVYDTELAAAVEVMIKDFRAKIPDTIGEIMAKTVVKYFK